MNAIILVSTSYYLIMARRRRSDVKLISQLYQLFVDWRRVMYDDTYFPRTVNSTLRAPCVSFIGTIYFYYVSSSLWFGCLP